MKTPPIPFSIFGAGNQPKFIYRRGELVDGLTREIRCRFDSDSATIDALAYRVDILERNGDRAVADFGHGSVSDLANRTIASVGKLRMNDIDFSPWGAAEYKEISL